MIHIKNDFRNRKTFISIDKATHNVREGLRDALTEIGKENVRHTQRLIKEPPKTGRFYLFRGRLHQASAPGQSPANRSGKLLKSVRYRTHNWDSMEFGDHVPYGKYLELGTHKMEPRPHLGRTVRQKRRDTYNALLNAVKSRITP